MVTNPFLSETYQKYWLKYFAKNCSVHRSALFGNFLFIKKPLLPVFYNLGGTLTKGLSYSIVANETLGEKNKVFVIFDVPSSFLPDAKLLSSNHLKILVSNQYAGYLCNFKEYPTLDSYLRDTLSAQSRVKLRRYKRKWEKVPDISYRMHLSDTSKDTYENLFKSFRNLMTKRFSQKKEYNRDLNQSEWVFYHKVTYPLMMEDKAGLFVTYIRDKPIAITLIMLEGSKLIDTLRVFDISYAKYRIGTLNILELLNWCYDQKIDSLDFAKGNYEYKYRWANTLYHFNYHIIYDPKSFYSVVTANLIYILYECKRILRQLNFFRFINRLRFYFQSRKQDVTVQL
ncbi:GNAT family N-acetyltransferase [Muriicola soli]|uniref:GNAT family N-acetyltransferase n=1 Tax=Muriicola soli TaxID=2507538 RepID=A0A411E8L8_9FLAO|nr:GNAT family N-acetyltransferase [Muriicola soli]